MLPFVTRGHSAVYSGLQTGSACDDESGSYLPLEKLYYQTY